MSKIICDVCGTSYPETATQCPICGCVRAGESQTIIGDTNTAPVVGDTGNYTYVKGGRFSKSNVRKRNRAAQNPAEKPVSEKTELSEGVSKTDIGLTVAVIALLLAIIAVVIYIVIHFFVPSNTGKNDPLDQTTGVVETTTVEDTTALESTQAVIACTDLILDTEQVLMEELDASWLLNVRAEPVDTTDTIVYESSDESVAIVSDDGLVTAVGNGTAIIRICCGEIETECEIICDIPDETTVPTEEETEPSEELSTEPETQPSVSVDAEFELNRDDFSLFFAGDSWDVYDGSVDAEQIAWSSDDEAIATITNGVVEAVGPGTTTVYGEYNGVKISCIVHCKFTVQSVQPETEETDPTTSSDETVAPEGSGEAGEETFSLNRTEFSLFFRGDSWNVYDGTIDADLIVWKSDNENIVTITAGVVTAVGPGTTTIYGEYNGTVLSCIVYCQFSA